MRKILINPQLKISSVWKEILLFAAPLAATGIMQQLFNAADIAVVGRFAGEQGAGAMAAVGASSPIIGLLISSFAGLISGTNVVVSYAIGQKDRNHLQAAIRSSLCFAVIGGCVLMAIGVLFGELILNQLYVPVDVLPMACTYIRIYFGGMPIILLYNFEAAIFRGAGDTRTPLVALIIAGSVNVLLNLFFVATLHMTVDGVATATVISNFLSALILFVVMLKKNYISFSSLKIHWDFDKQALYHILRIGLPAAAQSAIFSLANVTIQSAINSLGTITMAASSASSNVEVIAFIVLGAFSQACTTFVAQKHGAGQDGQCRKIMKICIAEGSIVAACVILVTLLGGRGILSLFNPDPQIVEVGYTRLRISLSCCGFIMLHETISGYLRGFGISFLPALLTTLGTIGVRFVWVLGVFPVYHTFESLLLVYPVSLFVTALLLLVAQVLLHPDKP